MDNFNISVFLTYITEFFQPILLNSLKRTCTVLTIRWKYYFINKHMVLKTDEMYRHFHSINNCPHLKIFNSAVMLAKFSGISLENCEHILTIFPLIKISSS